MMKLTVDNVGNILECNDNATSNVKVGNILECNDNATSNVKVGNILECNDNATSNVKVGNILECNDNTTSNLQKRDFTTDIVERKPLQGLQAFLERTGSCITDDTLHAVKTVFQNLMDQECVSRTDTSRMLNKFSGGRNEHLQFQLRMTELESRTSDVQELRDCLATSINVNPGQIIMTTMQSGRIFVTFMMKRAYIETFLNYIKTDDGQIAASWRRAGTVIKNKAVINIGH